jgi:phosphoglycerate dehydrogenase-like enzyme
MKVVAHDPYPDQAYAAAHGVAFLPLTELLQQADVVTLHAVAADPNRPLIGATELALMKASAYLINTARGQLVDEAALADALRNGNLAGAGLDVFASKPPGDSPLLHLENVVLTPHIGGRTDGGLRRMGQITLENCLLALQGQAPHYQAKAGVS